MIKENLQQKLKEYYTQRKRLEATYNAVIGAIQALEQLLNEVDKESKEEEPNGR